MGNSAFLAEMEYEVLRNVPNTPLQLLHPFVGLPLLGQILLATTLVQRVPSKWVTVTGMGCLLVLLGFVFLIGLWQLKGRMLVSTLPFMGTVCYRVLTLRNTRAKDF